MSSFGRHLHNAADDDPLNMRVQASLDGTLDELPNKFEFWNAEDTKEAVEGLQRADQRQQDIAENGKTGDVFLAGHKEYVDNKANALLMRNQMDTMFGKGLHPLEHFEAAYEYLRENTDFLKLNQAEVEKQRKAADKQRYKTLRVRNVEPTEEELYSMDMDELRRLDAITAHERMQRRGEEGGF